MKLVRVIPKTKKMTERVKAHGDVWTYVRTLDGKALIETTVPVYQGKHPYGRWVDASDCDLLPVNLDR